MTLLEATATLIDFAKTNAPESDRVMARAIKRMEKRLFVLQVRSAWARKRARINAFFDAMRQFGGGAKGRDSKGRLEAVILCGKCEHPIRFGEFCRGAEFTNGGRIETLTCPKCDNIMVRE